MSKPTASLTKICVNCAQQKPLSAFLQLTEQSGATYGNICSTCRKTVLTSSKESDESTASTTGIKIDAKTKVQGEIDKRALRKQKDEDYVEEREKQEQHQSQKVEKNLHTAKDEKKHRDSFLSQGLQRMQKKYASQSTSVFGGKTQTDEAAKMNSIIGPLEYTQVKVTQSEAFKTFKSWLGNSAPIVKATERALSNKDIKKKTGEKTATDILSEEIEETYKSRP